MFNKKYIFNPGPFSSYVSLPGVYFTSWWFQPIWKICSSKWVHLPQFSGWKFQKYLSCHHPVTHWITNHWSQLPVTSKCTPLPRHLKSQHHVASFPLHQRSQAHSHLRVEPIRNKRRDRSMVKPLQGATRHQFSVGLFHSLISYSTGFNLS